MKCPQCNARTEVDETRIQPDGSVKRTRTCINYHTFKTNEIISSPIKQKDKPEHDDDKVKNEAKRPDTDTVPFVTDEAKPMTHAKYLAKKSLKRMRTEMLGKISN